MNEHDWLYDFRNIALDAEFNVALWHAMAGRTEAWINASTGLLFLAIISLSSGVLTNRRWLFWPGIGLAVFSIGVPFVAGNYVDVEIYKNIASQCINYGGLY